MLRAVRRAALFSLAFTLIGCCHEDSASRPVGAGAAPSVSGNTSTSNGAEEKLVPYDDILRYPSDWPGISQRRSAANWGLFHLFIYSPVGQTGIIESLVKTLLALYGQPHGQSPNRLTFDVASWGDAYTFHGDFDTALEEDDVAELRR
jgi:hypothetical protein